jgi:hypothetical protein
VVVAGVTNAMRETTEQSYTDLRVA